MQAFELHGFTRKSWDTKIYTRNLVLDKSIFLFNFNYFLSQSQSILIYT